jgi:hypothetical protein
VNIITLHRACVEVASALATLALSVMTTWLCIGVSAEVDNMQ